MLSLCVFTFILHKAWRVGFWTAWSQGAFIGSDKSVLIIFSPLARIDLWHRPLRALVSSWSDVLITSIFRSIIEISLAGHLLPISSLLVTDSVLIVQQLLFLDLEQHWTDSLVLAIVIVVEYLVKLVERDVLRHVLKVILRPLHIFLQLPCAILFVDFVNLVRIHPLLFDFLVCSLKLLFEVGVLEDLILG